MRVCLSMYFACPHTHMHSLRFSLDLIAARCSCHGAAAAANCMCECARVLACVSVCLRSGTVRCVCVGVQTWTRSGTWNQANEPGGPDQRPATSVGRSNVLISTDANGNVKHNHCLCNWVPFFVVVGCVVVTLQNTKTTTVFFSPSSTLE